MFSYIKSFWLYLCSIQWTDPEAAIITAMWVDGYSDFEIELEIERYRNSRKLKEDTNEKAE
jgi:hypothetical protein